MKRHKGMDRTAMVVVFAGVCALGLLVGARAAGLRVNTSASIPLGAYRVTSERVARGRLVLSCPPPTPLFLEARTRGYLGPGLCPGGSDYLMKRVWAMPGDHIAIDDAGVRVNGVRVPNSAPRAVDSAGRPLPRYRVNDYVLPSQQYLLLSESHPRSFDGRYFGPVRRSEIIAVIRPLFVWTGDA